MTVLKQAREALGWSQARVMAELRRKASRKGLQLPGADTLKRQLSRWENGQVEPGELYRELFCELYARSSAELGFSPIKVSTEQIATGMVSRLALARSIGPETAKIFAAQVDAVRVLDRQMGAPAALDQLRGVSNAVQELLSHAILPASRAPMAEVLADVASLAGWQALDMGDVEQSWRWHETAKAAAREANDIPGLAHAMGQQAYVLMDIGHAPDAVQLVRAGQDAGGSAIPDVLVAWLAAAEAEACAAAGDDHGTRAALDYATATLPSTEDSELRYLSLNGAHLARWRGNALSRLGDGEAIDDLYQALGDMDSSFIRASAGLECDLATALLVRGDRTEARKHAARARELARRTGSVRQRRRVEALSLAA